MNVTTLMGFIAAIIVFIASVVTAFKDLRVLLDAHAAIIVLGGTASVALICFPAHRLITLFKVFFRRMFGKNKPDYMGLIEELVNLSKAYRKSFSAFESAIGEVKNPFLKDAASILFWVQSDVSPEEIRSLLETRVATHYKMYTEEAKVFKTLSKFPPAFGLMGTSIGMITLLQSLGGADASSQVGPAMAIALVATLYGLVFSNFLFTPIGENLTAQTQEDLALRSIVVEGIMLIADQKPTKYMEEKVKSFLLPSQRGEASGKGAK
jgi:chemotaxis protein MotA